MATYKPAEARNKLGEQIATPIIDVTGDSTYVVESSTISDDGKILATPIINVTEMATPIETDPVWESEKANYALKSEVNNLIDGIEVGDTITNNTLSITGNQLTSTITTDKDTFTSQVTIPGGGSTGTETDPIYMADKPNIALKSELVEPTIITNEIVGQELTSTITLSDNTTITSEPVTIPSGGGATPIYIESELVPTIDVSISPVIVSTITLPQSLSSGSDLKLNIQGNITRTGGASNVAGKILIEVFNNGGYGLIMSAKKEVARDVDMAFDLHSKKYHISNASPIQIKVTYTPTASEIITLTNVTGYVEG